MGLLNIVTSVVKFFTPGRGREASAHVDTSEVSLGDPISELEPLRQSETPTKIEEGISFERGQEIDAYYLVNKVSTAIRYLKAAQMNKRRGRDYLLPAKHNLKMVRKRLPHLNDFYWNFQRAVRRESAQQKFSTLAKKVQRDARRSNGDVKLAWKKMLSLQEDFDQETLSELIALLLNILNTLKRMQMFLELERKELQEERGEILDLELDEEATRSIRMKRGRDVLASAVNQRDRIDYIIEKTEFALFNIRAAKKFLSNPEKDEVEITTQLQLAARNISFAMRYEGDLLAILQALKDQYQAIDPEESIFMRSREFGEVLFQVRNLERDYNWVVREIILLRSKQERRLFPVAREERLQTCDRVIPKLTSIVKALGNMRHILKVEASRQGVRRQRVVRRQRRDQQKYAA